MTVIAIDVGSSGVRAMEVDDDGVVRSELHAEFLPSTPADGLVEFDALAYAALAIELANAVIERSGRTPSGVGVCNQRSTCVVWDRDSGVPLAPAQSWQDLRTAPLCKELASEGFSLLPSQAAPKAASILDAVDPKRQMDVCVGTLDSWLVWCLTDGAVHVTDLSNAATNGIFDATCFGWSERVLERLRIPGSALPSIVASSGTIGEATALPGRPMVRAILGDQQASLLGQGCVAPGMGKCTFGTGAMLDVCTGQQLVLSTATGGGTYPLVCWQRGDELTLGIEAVDFAAGNCVQWLRDGLGLIDDPAESGRLAASVPDADGVVFVPALQGLATPQWDWGARGALLGLSRGSTKAHVVRAVLEGIAQRGADLLETAQADIGSRLESLRVDGGMSRNETFISALADRCGCPIEVAPVADATGPGVAYLAGLEVGMWSGWDDIARLWKPRAVVEPTPGFPRDESRARWRDALARASGWHPGMVAPPFPLSDTASGK